MPGRGKGEGSHACKLISGGVLCVLLHCSALQGANYLPATTCPPVSHFLSAHACTHTPPNYLLLSHLPPSKTCYTLSWEGEGVVVGGWEKRGILVMVVMMMIDGEKEGGRGDGAATA